MTIEKRIQPKRAVRKSLEKDKVVKKHEAVKRYLFQMSDIPWEPHKKRQRTALKKRGRVINAVLADQTHVGHVRKDRLEKERTRVSLKRGREERRKSNAEFVDLLVLAKSAELLENKGVHNVDKTRDPTVSIGSKRAKKRFIRLVDKSLDSDGRIGNAQAEKDALHDFDKLLNATDRIGNAQAEKDALDESLDASDRIGNAQVGKDASRVRGRSRRTSFRHHALMYLGLEISRSIQKDEDADLKWIEETDIDDTVSADQVEGTTLVQDVPDLCISTERGPKGLEGVRKKASLVEAVTTNPKELRWRVERDKIIPRAVSMTANNGDYREQSDAFLRKNDRTGNMNCSLIENNPKRPQEQGHVPPCQTEPSLTHMSDAVQAGDPVADGTENWKQLVITHNSELLALQMAESLKEGPSVAREKRMQRTLERRKQRSGDPQPIVLQPDVRSRYILPQTKLVDLERGDRNEKGDVTRHLAKDATAKLDGSLQEKILKGRQECGHAPILLSPGVTFRYILPRTTQIVPEHGNYMGQGNVPRQLARYSTAQVNGSLQEKNLKGQQECGHAPFVLPPGVRSYYILPQTARMVPEHVDRMEKGNVAPQVAKVTTAKVNDPLQEKNLKNQMLDPVISFLRLHRMAPEHGDRMEKGNVTRQLEKDATSKVNGSLQEKNLTAQQERGHTPLVLQPGVRSHNILPQTANMAPEHGGRMEKGAVTHQLAKDTTARVDSSLQEKTLKTQQKCGHAPFNCETEPSSIHLSEVPENHNAVVLEGGKQKGPPVNMAPEHGGHMEKGVVTRQLAKDTTARVNTSLQEKTLKPQQKCGHAPFNSETEPSSIHLSEAPESRNAVVLDGGKQRGPPVSQMTKLGNHKFIAHLRQMLRSVDQRTLQRQKTCENEKHKKENFRSFKATRNYERMKAQQVQGAIHPQDTQDPCVATERAPQGLEGVRKQAFLVEAATKNTKALQPRVGPDNIIPQAVGMTVNIGYSRVQSDACLRRKDRPGNMNRSLNENSSRPLQEHGHVPPNCQTEPSLTRISNAAKDGDSVAQGGEKWNRPLVIQKSELLKHGLPDIRSDERVESPQPQRAIHLHDAQESPVIGKSESNKIADIRKEAPELDHMEVTNENSATCDAHQLTKDLCVSTERNPIGLEGVRKQASLMEAAKTNTEELQSSVESDKIAPPQISPFLEWLHTAVRMTANIRDSREQSDSCLLKVGMNNNCETESLGIHLSDALESRDSVALKDTRSDERTEAQHVRGTIHLQDTQDLCVATKQAPKGLEGIRKQAPLVEAMTKNTKEVQPRFECDVTIPRGVRMTANIGDPRELRDACLQRKDRSGNMNGSSNENNPMPPQVHGQVPPNCETEPSLIHMDAIHCEKIRRQLLIQRSESLANKLTGLLKEGPSVARHKRILRISERRKRRSGNPQPTVQQPETELEDCMEKDQLAEDTTAKVNGSLRENNLHCETESSLVHVSGPLESRDSVALAGEKNNHPTVSQTPEPRDIADIIAPYRQKTNENEKSENAAGSKSSQESPVIDELAGIMKQASLLESVEVTNENPVSSDTQQITEEGKSAKNDGETIPCEIRGEKRKLAEDEDFANGGRQKRVAMGQLSERLKEVARDTARDKRTLRRMIRRNKRNGVKNPTTDLNFTRAVARHKRRERRLLRMKQRHGVDLPRTVDLHRGHVQ